MKIGKIIYIAAIVILLVIFVVSAVYVIDYFLDSAQQKAEYDELAGIVESIQKETPEATKSTVPSETASTEPTEEGGILPEYAPLYEMNDHMVGWLRIDGTNINYPVMQTPESKDYYLYRNFNREYNIRGCLYARESCDINIPSDNITIYGHNMNDGSMFHDLLGYQFEEFYQDHSLITFDTLTEWHTYKIFAVFKTTASVGQGFSYHKFENAADEQEFDNFVATCKRLAFFDTGITPQYGDKLICLSTCEYTLENGRFVVVAYRVS